MQRSVPARLNLRVMRMGALSSCLALACLPASAQDQADSRALRSGEPGVAHAETGRIQQLFIRGMAELKLGNFEAASRLISEALAAQPEDVSLLSALAEAREGAGDLTAAVAHAREAARLAPSNAHFGVQAARLLSRAGRSEEAIAAYRGVLVGAPRTTHAIRELASLLADAGRPAEAALVLEQQPGASEAGVAERRLLFDLYADAGDTARALHALKLLTALDLVSAEPRLRLAELLAAQGDTLRALRMLDAAEPFLAQDPDRAATASGLKQSLSRSLHLPTEQAGVAEGPAVLLRGADDGRTGPAKPDYVLSAETVLAALRDARQHAEALRSQVERTPRDLALWSQTIEALGTTGLASEAGQVAEEALLLFPRQPGLLRAAADVLTKQERYGEAGDLLREALAILEADGASADARAEVLASTALLNARQQRWSRADSLYREALRLAPDHSGVRSRYAELLARNRASLPEAQRLVEPAADAPATDPLLPAAARTALLSGELDTAHAYLARAMRAGSISVELISTAADLLAHEGKAGEAQQLWQEALRMDPKHPAVIERLNNSQGK